MKSIFAAVALICAPLTAHAIPVVAGNSYGGALELTPGEVVSIEFEITEPTFISPIAISGTGTTAADLLAVTFGVNEFQAKFSDTIFLGNVAAGYAVLEGFLALENFSLLLTDGVVSPVQLTYNFFAEVPAPAPVPLPAAGVLLAGGLSLLGVGKMLRRRRGADTGASA